MQTRVENMYSLKVHVQQSVSNGFFHGVTLFPIASNAWFIFFVTFCNDVLFRHLLAVIYFQCPQN